MTDMFSKKQKAVLLFGIIAVFAIFMLSSMTTEIKVWQPEGSFTVIPGLIGSKDEYPVGTGQTAQAPIIIEQKTGLTLISPEAFKKRFRDDVKIYGRNDGNVMYVHEQDGFFTLINYKPNIFRALEPTEIFQKDNSVYVRYERGGGIVVFALGLEIMAWLILFLFLCSVSQEEIHRPGSVVD